MLYKSTSFTFTVVEEGEQRAVLIDSIDQWVSKAFNSQPVVAVFIKSP